MTAAAPDPSPEDAARRLVEDVLEPLKASFVGKDEVVDLLGVSLVAGENLFILGPPGTAKSALVRELGRRLGGRTFEYLLTRFTEPNELFGPFDIRRLREGELVTNVEGMLPEASLVFLDELLNANSAILNGLLMVLNERIFRRGRETRPLPTLMVVGASNHLPEDDALQALFDRFLLRVRCDNVPEEKLVEVLEAGWRHDLRADGADSGGLGIAGVQALQQALAEVDVAGIRSVYVELVRRLRYAGLPLSDRRAVKLQRLMAASALLCGRRRVEISDAWVLRYIWDIEEQREVLAAVVDEAIQAGAADDGGPAHPRSRAGERVDPEAVARDLAAIDARLERADKGVAEAAWLRDRLGILTGRIEWVENTVSRDDLRAQAKALWARLEAEQDEGGRAQASGSSATGSA